MMGWVVAWKCFVAWRFGESSQQPTCPQICRWSGAARPELRAEKSHGMPENVLTAEGAGYDMRDLGGVGAVFAHLFLQASPGRRS